LIAFFLFWWRGGQKSSFFVLHLSRMRECGLGIKSGFQIPRALITHTYLSIHLLSPAVFIFIYLLLARAACVECKISEFPNSLTCQISNQNSKSVGALEIISIVDDTPCFTTFENTNTNKCNKKYLMQNTQTESQPKLYSFISIFYF